MIRASSLSSVSSVGVDRMLAPTCVSSARARKARLVIVPRPGIVTVPLMTPSASPWPTVPGLAAMSMMLLPLPRAAEVGAADHPGLRRVVAGQRLPLDAELGRLVGGHLDDQRLDEHLGATDIELLDDRAQVVVDRLGRHDHERIARGVRGDRRAIGGERRHAAGRRARQWRGRGRLARTAGLQRGAHEGRLRGKRRPALPAGSRRPRRSASRAASARPARLRHSSGRR